MIHTPLYQRRVNIMNADNAVSSYEKVSLWFLVDGTNEYLIIFRSVLRRCSLFYESGTLSNKDYSNKKKTK